MPPHLTGNNRGYVVVAHGDAEAGGDSRLSRHDRGWLIFIALLLVLATAAYSSKTHRPMFAPPVGSFEELGPRALYFEDISRVLTIDDIRARDENLVWHQTGDVVPSFGFSRSAYWIKLRIRNDDNTRIERLLEVGLPVLDSIDVHLYVAEQRRVSYFTGDLQPFFQRPIAHRKFVLPVALGAQETGELYLRIQSSSALQVPLRLWEQHAFYGQLSVQGLFYGILIASIIYNLFLFASLFERSYLYLALFLTALALLLASMAGYAYQFLWPESVRWNGQAVRVLLCTVTLFFSLYTRQYLDLRETHPGLNKLLRALGWVATTVAVAVFVAPGAVRVHIPVALFMGLFALSLSSGLAAWIEGGVAGRHFTVSWSIFLVGGVVLALVRYGVLPSNSLTEHSVELGAIFPVLVLLYLGLSRSIGNLRQEHINERQRAMHDALTGLPNRRLLGDRLTHALEKAQSRGRTMAVLFMDLDGFKTVNDVHGHAAGDLLLKDVAVRLRGTVRGGDTVARLGGDEFAIVLEDLSHPQDADLVARKVLAALEPPFVVEGDSVTVGASVGIGTYPADGVSTETLTQSADQAMYQAKEAGKNCIRFADARQPG